jgi:hypothetical protein
MLTCSNHHCSVRPGRHTYSDACAMKFGAGWSPAAAFKAHNLSILRLVTCKSAPVTCHMCYSIAHCCQPRAAYWTAHLHTGAYRVSIESYSSSGQCMEAHNVTTSLWSAVHVFCFIIIIITLPNVHVFCLLGGLNRFLVPLLQHVCPCRVCIMHTWARCTITRADDCVHMTLMPSTVLYNMLLMPFSVVVCCCRVIQHTVCTHNHTPLMQ